MMLNSTPQNNASPEARKRKLFSRLFLALFAASLPATAVALAVLTTLTSLAPHPDISGLTAVSIGIVGILAFFIFLYKYQTYSGLNTKQRWVVLAIHACVILMLFAFVIWLGFYSPWKGDLVWGSYDLEIASRSWIISIIVIGVITLLGSFFDLIRKLTPDSMVEM